MADKSKVIFTGGSGLLGSEFRKIRPDIDYPWWGDFNVTKLDQMREYVRSKGCELLVHAAAFRALVCALKKTADKVLQSVL